MSLIPDGEDDFPFGKYGPKEENRTYDEVPAQYFDWLRDQDWLKDRWPQVWAYIEHNAEAIDAELEGRA